MVQSSTFGAEFQPRNISKFDFWYSFQSELGTWNLEHLMWKVHQSWSSSVRTKFGHPKWGSAATQSSVEHFYNIDFEGWKDDLVYTFFNSKLKSLQHGISFVMGTKSIVPNCLSIFLFDLMGVQNLHLGKLAWRLLIPFLKFFLKVALAQNEWHLWNAEMHHKVSNRCIVYWGIPCKFKRGRRRIWGQNITCGSAGCITNCIEFIPWFSAIGTH